MTSEKRLIDANELKSRMFSYYGCVNEHTSKITYTGETLMDYEVAGLIEDCIDGANTVDAVEMVHARWENGHCTNCKQNAEVQSIGFNCTGGIRIDYKETNYCPNCGAKMDGDVDNENS